MQLDHIRRRPDGAIDTQFYREGAGRMRAEAVRGLIPTRNIRRVSLIAGAGLVAIAVAVALALAPALHRADPGSAAGAQLAASPTCYCRHGQVTTYPQLCNLVGGRQ